MFSKKKSKEESKEQMQSTQKFLEIEYIKDDALILKDGSLRSVLLVSSINMEIRTEEEQDIIISAYQGALNSLNFQIQLLAQSRKVDLSSYLSTLQRSKEQQKNTLLREQTSEYINFLQDILTSVNVMDKKFFVITPHFPNILAQGSTGLLSALGLKKKTVSSDYTTDLQNLNQKTNIVIALLKSFGLRTTLVPTEGLIELFYSCYNPGVSENEHIESLDSLGADYISTRESIKKDLEQ